MTVRSLDLLDIPTMARYRNEVVVLDSARALTRGHPLGAMGLLAYINPRRHLYAAIANGGEAPLLGGVIHTRGDSYAKLLYLAPSSHLKNPELPDLIEHLAAQAGEWEAFQILAEVESGNHVFAPLRTAGFSVYAWQRMWDVSQIEKIETAEKSQWRRMRSTDLPAVQSLHYQIVPPLLHPIEPAPKRIVGFVHDHEIKCYASVTSGMYGIVLTPLIHPEERHVVAKIATLLNNLPDRRGRRVYLNVRSYQSWLESALEELGAQPSERQAVMVKHLARLVKEGVPARAVPSSVRVQPSQITRNRIDTDE